jgi:hypothetical protein
MSPVCVNEFGVKSLKNFVPAHLLLALWEIQVNAQRFSIPGE